MERGQFECIVAGGGAAGLSAAIGLAQAGIETLVLGVPMTARDDGRSAALFNANLRFLDRLGVGESLRAQGSPLRAIRIIDVTGALIRAPTTTFRATDIGQDCFGWNIPNARIVATLAAAARATPGLSVSDALFERFEATASGIRVFAGGDAPFKTGILIGADGQKSRVRETAGIFARIKPYPQAALTCRLHHSADHEAMSLEFHTREGPFTLVPAGPNLSALVWMMAPSRAEALRALPGAALAEAITRQSMSALGPLTIDGPIGIVPLQRLVAEQLVRGRVALVGEAAHAVPPIGAQGLNLGLQDVAALVGAVGRAKSAGRDLAEALPGYARSRRLDVELRVTGVDLLNTALIADRFPVDLARAAGLAMLSEVAPLRRLAMRLGGWSPLFAQPH